MAIFKKKKKSISATEKKKIKQPAREEVAAAVSEINNVQSPLAEDIIGGLR